MTWTNNRSDALRRSYIGLPFRNPIKERKRKVVTQFCRIYTKNRRQSYIICKKKIEDTVKSVFDLNMALKSARDYLVSIITSFTACMASVTFASLILRARCKRARCSTVIAVFRRPFVRRAPLSKTIASSGKVCPVSWPNYNYYSALFISDSMPLDFHL